MHAKSYKLAMISEFIIYLSEQGDMVDINNLF